MRENIVSRLAKLDTCAASDALDRLGLPGAVIEIRPVWPCARVVGRVVTIKLKPVGRERPKQHLGATAIGAAGPGDVLVVDNAGRLNVSSWGSILSLAAKAKQIHGVIIDGVCRDVDEIQQIGFPAFARGVVPITARGRIMEESFNQEIRCGAVPVRPGDFAVADGSGVVFIPSQRADEVVAAAEAIAEKELAAADALRAGRAVAEVLESMRYESMLVEEQKEKQDAVVVAFQNISITAASDALDRLGLQGTCLGIGPVVSGYHVAGRAFTVKYLPILAEKGTVGDFLDDVPKGSMVVLDNAGRLDGTVWGDIMTLVANKKGVAGTVIDGVCRDVKRSIEIGYPIFSRGKFMRTGKDRVQAVGVNVPVEIGGVQVRPGDIMLASEDGVIVIPKEKEADVLALARQIEETEERIRNEVLVGTSLKQARLRQGYHQLQRADTRNGN